MTKMSIPNTNSHEIRVGTTEVPLHQVISSIKYSSDFGPLRDGIGAWNFVELYADINVKIPELYDSFCDHGFNSCAPILIVQGVLTNGHHRLATAILMNLDTVWVTDRIDLYPSTLNALDWSCLCDNSYRATEDSTHRQPTLDDYNEAFYDLLLH